MTAPAKTTSLHTYQTILYDRALHPELFPLKGRRVVRHGAYEFEAWTMPGAHLLRFEHGPICTSELVTDREDNLPDTGVISALLCAGEHEFEHEFGSRGVRFMTSVQTESLSESLFQATFEELEAHALESDALVHHWADSTGACLSLVDVQRYNREVHAQCYHLQANGGIVLRTQTIFEHA